MDILVRIRLGIWLLVLALWGILLYQFMGEDIPEPSRRMHWVSNPFPKPPSGDATPVTPPPSESLPWEGAARMATAPPPSGFIKPIVPKSLPIKPLTATPHHADRSLRRNEYAPTPEPATPTGFIKTETDHFHVFSEKEPAPEKFIETLENLHINLMLDLAAFSPWARDEKVSIFLFRDQQSYRKVTGRPAWSGGASSVSKRRIYLYESEEVIGILAHELCHLYFDGFFIGGKPNPLWLSEGMATLVQIERGLNSPNWLPENLDILYRGGGFDLSDLMRIDNTSGANDDNVRLWYAQAYSVVRFLLRVQWKASFYNFCRYLREGTQMQEALYRAYGMPYNRVKALEYAWRYDIETHRITRLRTVTQ